MNYKHGGYSKDVWAAVPNLTVKDAMERLEDLEEEAQPINPIAQALA